MLKRFFNTEVKLFIACIIVILLSMASALKIKAWHEYTYMNLDKAVSYVELSNGVGIILDDGSSVYLEIPKEVK